MALRTLLINEGIPIAKVYEIKHGRACLVSVKRTASVDGSKLSEDKCGESFEIAATVVFTKLDWKILVARNSLIVNNFPIFRRTGIFSKARASPSVYRYDPRGSVKFKCHHRS